MAAVRPAGGRARGDRRRCVFLDQPEKRRKRQIAALDLRIVDRYPLVFDAKGDLAAVIDAKRLPYRLGHGRLSLGRDRSTLGG
jgi:hypothetical protein